MPATLDSPQPAASGAPSAAEHPVVVTGTPFGRWPPLAQAVATASGAVLAPAGPANEAWLAPHSSQLLLVFVDGPAQAVARWLETSAGGEASQTLRAWCDASQRILRHAHAHPSSCVLVDTAEAAAHPSALRRLLSGRLGLDCDALDDAHALPGVDAVALGLATGLARQSRQALELHTQLQASCMPLSGTDADNLAPEPVDMAAAVRRWQDLSGQLTRLEARHALERKLAETTARLEAAQAESDELLVQLHASQEALEAQLLAQKATPPALELAQRRAAELESLRGLLQGESRVLAERTAALDQARQELAQWRQAADSRQLEAEQAREQWQAAQRLLADRGSELERLAGALRAADETHTRLQSEVDRATLQSTELRAAAAQQASRLDTLQAEVRASSSMLADRTQALERSRRDADQLQMQLHTVQEELEHHFLALQALESAPPGMGGSRTTLSVGELRFTDASHVPPHHHLQAELRHIDTSYLALQQLTVRIVEHAGHPGLVLLAAESGPVPLLAAWQPTGAEGGRPLMTLVPSDAAAQRTLQSLAPGDWRFIVELVALLRHRLADAAAHPEAARWRTVAARLQRQLADLPPRLRYSQVGVTTEVTDGRQPRLAVRFSDVIFGLEARDDLLLTWQPGAAQAPLRLAVGGSDSVPPLAGWPTDPDGQPALEWAVPVGPGMVAVEKRRRWAALSTADRALVLALLDALPACADATADAALPPGLEREALRSAARELYRDALRSRRQARWRSALRATLRRLGGR
jgi:hypothetical protein